MPSYFTNLPPQFEPAQQAEIMRRQKLAQMLQEQSMQPIQAQQGGAFASPISPLQVFGKLAQGYVGAKGGQEAAQQQQELQTRMQQERAAALAKALQQAQGAPQPAPELGGGPAMPPDPMGAAGTLMNAPDPALQQMGGSMFAQQMKPPPPPQPFNLSPGQTRFGPDGKPVASLPPTPPAPQKPQIIQTAQGPMMLNEQGQAVPIPGPGGVPVQAPPKQPIAEINLPGDEEYGKRATAKAVDRDFEQADVAQAAQENIIKINQQLDLMKNSQAITGLGSEVFKNVERAKALFLQDKAAGKRVSDTELLDALLGQDVFPMIKQLGIGARGLDTPAERDFLRNVMTGTTPLNRDTLIRLAEIRRDISKRAIDRWNNRVEKGELDRYFKAVGTPRTKIEIPSIARAPGQPPEGIDPAVWNMLTPEQKALWQN